MSIIHSYLGKVIDIKYNFLPTEVLLCSGLVTLFK